MIKGKSGPIALSNHTASGSLTCPGGIRTLLSIQMRLFGIEDFTSCLTQPFHGFFLACPDPQTSIALDLFAQLCQIALPGTPLAGSIYKCRDQAVRTGLCFDCKFLEFRMQTGR